jgi:hypothetical protein
MWEGLKVFELIYVVRAFKGSVIYCILGPIQKIVVLSTLY